MIHELSYKRLDIAGLIHRLRRRCLMDVFKGLMLPIQGSLADFGCSNGYMISVLQAEVFHDKDWRFIGFDHTRKLLDAAERKQLPNTAFRYLELNEENGQLREQYDVCTCLETMEHLGNVQTALSTVFNACKPGGHVILTVPNETGFAGLLKLIGRPLHHRNAYGDFFKTHSAAKYFTTLLKNQDISSFRDPEALAFKLHLGFDYRRFEQTLMRIVKSSRGKFSNCRIIKTFLGMNRIYVLN